MMIVEHEEIEEITVTEVAPDCHLLVNGDRRDLPARVRVGDEVGIQWSGTGPAPVAWVRWVGSE